MYREVDFNDFFDFLTVARLSVSSLRWKVTSPQFAPMNLVQLIQKFQQSIAGDWVTTRMQEVYQVSHKDSHFLRSSIPITDPWDWYIWSIHLHGWLMFMVNVDNYTYHSHGSYGYGTFHRKARQPDMGGNPSTELCASFLPLKSINQPNQW